MLHTTKSIKQIIKVLQFLKSKKTFYWQEQNMFKKKQV